MGASRNSWGAVVPAVAASTTAVVYDRSGLGRSAPADGPRDLDRLSDDLLDVLDSLGEGPFVLVGHSWGGPIIRVAVAKRPQPIAGLVLVDQTDENCDLMFNGSMERQTKFGLRLMPILARIGFVKLFVRGQARQLPEPWASAMRAEDGTRVAVAEQVAELEPCVEDLRRLRDEPLWFPDVPVTVISGTKIGFMEKNRRGPLVESHRATATSCPQGRHVTADNSSHYVPMTDPDVVADEVLRIIEAFRSRTDQRQ